MALETTRRSALSTFTPALNTRSSASSRPKRKNATTTVRMETVVSNFQRRKLARKSRMSTDDMISGPAVLAARRRLVGADDALFEAYHAIGIFGGDRIVRHHDHGLAELGVEEAQQFHDLR